MDLTSFKIHINSLQQKPFLKSKNDEVEEHDDINSNKIYHKNIKKTDFYEKTIKPDDFYLKNEISISKKLMTISEYYDYFNILYKHEIIEINEISEKNIENVKIDDTFILCYYRKYKSTTPFFSFILNSTSPYHLIHNIIDSYLHMNKILLKLDSIDICFYDILPEKIYFFENSKPILSNFEKSININNLTVTYLSKIIGEHDNYTYKCLELHILFHLLVNKEETITYDIANKITDGYIENLKILRIFSIKMLNQVKETVFSFVEKYINNPKIFIIEEMVQSIKTWDNYSVGFIYLFLLSNVIRVFHIKNTFINILTSSIFKSIGCIPSKRESLLDITEKINVLFKTISPNTFDFIHEMKNDDMNALYDNIFH